MRRVFPAVLLAFYLSACIGGRPSPNPTSLTPSPTELATPSPLLPQTAEIVCNPPTMEILTPVIQPRVDGVWFAVHNTSSQEVTFDAGDPLSSGPGQIEFASSGDNHVAPRSTKMMRWIVPPGPTWPSCATAAQQVSTVLQVVDPQRLYRPIRVPYGCTETTYAFSTPINFSSTGEVYARVRHELRGVRSNDVLDRVGCPDQPHIWVSILRDGAEVALVSLQPTLASEAGSSVLACIGSGIRPRSR